MKKTFLALTLVFVFSIAALGEGNTPVGGRNCSENQPCCPENQSCLVVGSEPKQESENTIVVFIKRIIAEIF